MNGTQVEMPLCVLLRFQSLYEVDRLGCWQWRGTKNDKGYAHFHFGKQCRAARVSYEHYHGKIPGHMTVHHVCNDPGCVCPSHLMLLSLRENILVGNGPSAINSRKTHCIRGHPLSGENLYRWKTRRFCRICRRTRVT